MPRDIQEALFETVMKGQDAEPEELAHLLHDRHPRTLHHRGAILKEVSRPVATVG